ncbi:WD_REPEATS_REGION domain-containing protein [Haematococcus lacustris]|uniref:WD_REPEATS_REGION domain-containing protein n=1 Tax=Haematococcus lacustris TaxID=44745 RepID=A0A699YIC1_HAELA|nr:WD_REPEATS_REGION domain-containing protein [Haematococcus lacustris]GFH13310.1 WD_REPEATS_REGION domain-containing protein [Haematococcus lacustris]
MQQLRSWGGRYQQDHLHGHRCAVRAVKLLPSHNLLATGSWDYTVRVWSREEGENGPGFQCVNVLGYDDWVGSVTARGGHLLVSAGVEVLVHDLGTGQVLRKFQNLHEGHVNCLEGSHSGRMLFTGSGDGLVLAHDLRMRDPTSVLW